MMKVHLLIIDPQNDFCDPKGALSVNGAQQDMARLSAMVKRLGNRLDDIHVTLDTHHYIDIAHPVFWINSTGQNPPPFTIISADDVERGIWVAAMPAYRDWAKEYTRKLETNQRYALCVWPPHCLIGSWGGQVEAGLFAALGAWEERRGVSVAYAVKGTNPLTEHYSAIRADVPLADDPGTQANRGLVEALGRGGDLLVAGEALSHCVRFTVQDLLDAWPPERAGRVALLEDAMSSVGGFEAAGREFLAAAADLGVRRARCADFS